MANLRLVKPRHTLVYGMRLLPGALSGGEAPEGPGHQQVKFETAENGEAVMTLHSISGDKGEIRQRLLESVDAFFELFAEELP